MLRAKWIRAAVSAAALMALAAGTAHAQEYGRGGGGGSARGSGKFQPVVGIEAWLDSRGMIYSDAEAELIGSGTVTTFDETSLEHDIENVYQHHGLFAKVGGRLDLNTPVSFGLRLGSFTANNRNSTSNPGAARIVTDVVSKPGFATGIWADIRVPLGSGMWVDGVFDFYYGMASIDNITPIAPPGFAMQGEYDFMNAELTGRFGFDVSNSGVSPFIGFEFAYFQVNYDLEDPRSAASGDLDSLTATAESWSPFRIIFGVELAPNNSAMAARLQIAIWNPGRDFGGAVEASFPIG